MSYSFKYFCVTPISSVFSVLGCYYKIIEQEINKMAIYTHVIFRPRKTF